MDEREYKQYKKILDLMDERNIPEFDVIYNLCEHLEVDTLKQVEQVLKLQYPEEK